MTWGVFERSWGCEVLPTDDLRQHRGGEACPCKPYWDDGVLVHNSFDQREKSEPDYSPPPGAVS